MKLYFSNSHGETRLLCECDPCDVMKHIQEFCNEHGFKIYYTRRNDMTVDEKLMTVFDVGSWSEFFYTDPPMPKGANQ